MPVRSIAFSPDGTYLATGGGIHHENNRPYYGGKGELVVWNVSNGKPAARDEASFSEYISKAFFLKGDVAGVFTHQFYNHTRGNPVGDYQISQIEISSNKKRQDIFLKGWVKPGMIGVDPINSLFIYVPEPKIIDKKRVPNPKVVPPYDEISIYGKPELCILNLLNGNIVSKWPLDSIINFELSSQGEKRILITEKGQKNKLRRFDFAIGKAEDFIELESTSVSFKIAGDGERVAVLGSNGNLEVYQVASKERVALIKFKENLVTDILGITPDGRKVALKTGASEFRIYNVGDQSMYMEHKADFFNISCESSFSPDGSLFAVGFYVKKYEGPLAADGGTSADGRAPWSFIH